MNKDDKIEKISKEEFENLLCLLLDTDGKSLNDLSEQEIKVLYAKQIVPHLEEDNKADDESSKKQSSKENEELKYGSVYTRYPHLFLLNKKQFNLLLEKMDTLTSILEKKFYELSGLKLIVKKPVIRRFLLGEYNDYLDNAKTDYMKTLLIDGHELRIFCNPSLVNRVFLPSYDNTFLSELKKRIANNFIFEPLLQSLDELSSSSSFKNREEIDCKNVEKHFSSFSNVIQITIEITDEDGDEEEELVIMTNEEVLLDFLNEKRSEAEYIPFTSNTSYIVLNQGNISEKDIKNIKRGDRLKLAKIGINNPCPFYRGNELIKDSASLEYYGPVSYGLTEVPNSSSYQKEDVIELSKYDFLIISCEKERDNEEIEKIRKETYSNLSTDISSYQTLLYKNRFLAKGILYNGGSYFLVTSVLEAKKGKED